MLLALALAAPPVEGPVMAPMERADLVEMFGTMIRAMDRDHDGRVSRAEWLARMTGTRDNDRAIPIRMAFDAPPEQVFRNLDSNTDGLLTAEELGHGMLATFDCLDADHDGSLQPAEEAAERPSCAAAERPATPPASPTP